MRFLYWIADHVWFIAVAVFLVLLAIQRHELREQAERLAVCDAFCSTVVNHPGGDLYICSPRGGTR